jgi:DNA repair exonuclease SbcCD ATPase subunit
LEKNVHGEIPLLNSLDEELHRLGDRKSSFEEQEKELLRLHQQEIDSFKARIAEADQMNEELIKKKTDLEAQIESCKQGASKHEEY